LDISFCSPDAPTLSSASLAATPLFSRREMPLCHSWVTSVLFSSFPECAQIPKAQRGNPCLLCVIPGVKLFSPTVFFYRSQLPLSAAIFEVLHVVPRPCFFRPPVLFPLLSAQRAFPSPRNCPRPSTISFLDGFSPFPCPLFEARGTDDSN